MKEKLINNLGMKILSICLAVFLWIIIVNVDDPIKTRTFTNVPVTVLNESTLTSKNKAYDIESGDTVDFTVSGKRSELEKIKKTDFVATADLSQLTADFDTVKINVECTKYQDLEITMGKVSTMTIRLEDIISESYSIKVVTSGACAPGYAKDTTEASPVLIEVSGAESIIEEIADVKVLVDISGASSDVTETVYPKAYNEKGVEIDSDKLTFSYSEVTVKVTILETKTIPVLITTTGDVAYGYEFVKAEYEPQEIEIKGDSEALNSLSNLTILIDINGLTGNEEYTKSIQDQLDAYGVSIVDTDIENLVIKVTVEKLVEKTFNITQSDITIDNLDESLSSDFTDSSTIYTVKVMGLQEDIDELSVTSMAPTIDLAGLTAGKHKVALTFTLPDTVTLMSDVKVSVKLSKSEEDEQPEASEVPDTSDDADSQTGTDTSEEPSVEPSQTPSASPDTSTEEEETDEEE